MHLSQYCVFPISFLVRAPALAFSIRGLGGPSVITAINVFLLVLHVQYTCTVFHFRLPAVYFWRSVGREVAFLSVELENYTILSPIGCCRHI